MSRRRNRTVFAVLGTLVAMAILAGYLVVMAVSLPASLLLKGGMGSCLSSGTTVSIGLNPPGLGTTELPQETLDRIEQQDLRGRAEQNMERYTYAEEQTGVPWYVVATLHYREGGMRGEASALNGQPILGFPYVNVDGQMVGANPKEDAVNAANALKRLAAGVYDVDVTQDNLTLEDWGWAYLAYNRGYLFKRVGASYTVSPYVMNGFDDQHMNMSWSSADTVRGVDGNKIGALAAMTYLSGQSLGGCGDGSIVAPIVGDNLVITSGAGQRGRYSDYSGQYVNRPHNGLDLVGGSEIVSMAKGTVTLAQDRYDGYGTAVKIDHGNGMQSLYVHMVEGSLKVSQGATVSAGQPLGIMGNTGDSDGVHLHFEVWQDDVRINPYPLLVENGVKLTWKDGATPFNEKPGPF